MKIEILFWSSFQTYHSNGSIADSSLFGQNDFWTSSHAQHIWNKHRFTQDFGINFKRKLCNCHFKDPNIPAFQDLNMKLSALDENLGPSTVTIVPFSLITFSRLASLAAWTMIPLVFGQNEGCIGIWQTVPKSGLLGMIIYFNEGRISLRRLKSRHRRFEVSFAIILCLVRNLPSVIK